MFTILPSSSSTSFYLAASLSSGIKIYSINEGTLLSTLQGHTSSVFDLAQHNPNTLASVSKDVTVRIWDLAKNTCKFILKGHTNTIYSLKQITTHELIFI